MQLPSKTVSFWVLMGISALAAFVLPSRWTTPGRGLFQPLALLQWPTKWLAARGHSALGQEDSEPVPTSRAQALQRENEQLRRQIIHQQLAWQETQLRLAELTRLTGQLPDSHIRIVIAPVVGFDANPRRATLLIARGQQPQWVEVGQWVVAAGDLPTDSDFEPTLRDLIYRGWAVGRVSEVHPQSARVQLTTDPAFRTPVRFAGLLADGTVQMAPERCMLQGAGGQTMRISQATGDYYESGLRIVMVPSSPELPTPLTLGRIERATRRDDSAQHFDLVVIPWAPLDQLTHVYVLLATSED